MVTNLSTETRVGYQPVDRDKSWLPTCEQKYKSLLPTCGQEKSGLPTCEQEQECVTNLWTGTRVVYKPVDRGTIVGYQPVDSNKSGLPTGGQGQELVTKVWTEGH